LKFEWNGGEWYIDGYIADQLNSIAYNINKDWDFVIILTGDRSVRVGKSVLGMTICAYLAYLLKRLKLNDDAYGLEDVFFDNQKMIERAFKKPKYSINHYDEGREGLAANKAMKIMQQDLMDFFAECGQLNHIFVIVAPDFFRLNEEIAVARSEFLINVYRKEQQNMIDLFKDGNKKPVIKLKRGQFEFFNRKRKQNLFDKSQSTRRRSYALIKHNFIGSFTNQYPLGREEYVEKKKEALSRFLEKKKAEQNKPDRKDKRIKQLAEALGFFIEGKGEKERIRLSEEMGEAPRFLDGIRKTIKKHDML